jgi:hypothetical protein
MDFALTDEHREFQDLCHRFAVEVMRPVAARYDRDQEVPWEVMREARRWGLHGLELMMRMGEDPHGQLASPWRSPLPASPPPGSPPRARPRRSRSGCPSASAPARS